MFNIGASELLVILLIAFLVVGPKDLPKVGRALGRLVRQAKGFVEEIKRETGMDELQADLKEIENTTRAAAKDMDIRPELEKARKDLNKEMGELEKRLSLEDASSKTGGK